MTINAQVLISRKTPHRRLAGAGSQTVVHQGYETCGAVHRVGDKLTPEMCKLKVCALFGTAKSVSGFYQSR